MRVQSFLLASAVHALVLKIVPLWLHFPYHEASQLGEEPVVLSSESSWTKGFMLCRFGVGELESDPRNCVTVAWSCSTSIMTMAVMW
ncbi:hypothetical protein F4775DRAFT_539937 [Biscogniauxia sp. FL1348]|nr:hypothetical protein F4775DRAFT_539937 [Biscogniauxia sp. FL1348]